MTTTDQIERGYAPLRVDPLLEVGEVAKMLGVSKTFVYEHSTGGVLLKLPDGSERTIPFVKIGGAVRFRRSSMERFIADLERVA